MKEVILSAKDISKQFSGETVLNHISMEIYLEDFTVIMGSSGAGKSTLLYALSGMDAISEGQVFYQGQEISGLGEKKMAALRAKEFGFVFQQTCLVSNLTLLENVTVAGYLGSSPEKEVRQRAAALLEQMHVEKARNRLPGQVSGGESQRAAIARAVINRPGLLFADEPTSVLDPESRRTEHPHGHARPALRRLGKPDSVSGGREAAGRTDPLPLWRPGQR